VSALELGQRSLKGDVRGPGQAGNRRVHIEDMFRRIQRGRRVACYPTNFCLTNITTMNLGMPEYGFRGNSVSDRRIARGHLDVVLQS
jgi:hypothetical protein